MDDLDRRIEELETLIAPLQAELRQLRKQRATRQAGQRSAAQRQQRLQARNEVIKSRLRTEQDQLYQRHTGGLIKRLAQEYHLTERTISRLYAQTKQEVNE